MAYSEKVVDHYENPRNVGSLDKNDSSVGTGMVGAPECGDVMKLQIKVNVEGVIKKKYDFLSTNTCKLSLTIDLYKDIFSGGSTKSTSYLNPEHPPPRRPTVRTQLSGLSSLLRSSLAFVTARSVIVKLITTPYMTSSGPLSWAPDYHNCVLP